MEETIILSDDK